MTHNKSVILGELNRIHALVDNARMELLSINSEAYRIGSEDMSRSVNRIEEYLIEIDHIARGDQ